MTAPFVSRLRMGIAFSLIVIVLAPFRCEANLRIYRGDCPNTKSADDDLAKHVFVRNFSNEVDRSQIAMEFIYTFVCHRFVNHLLLEWCTFPRSDMHQTGKAEYLSLRNPLGKTFSGKAPYDKAGYDRGRSSEVFKSIFYYSSAGVGVNAVVTESDPSEEYVKPFYDCKGSFCYRCGYLSCFSKSSAALIERSISMRC